MDLINCNTYPVPVSVLPTVKKWKADVNVATFHISWQIGSVRELKLTRRV